MIRYLWMFHLTGCEAFARSEQWYEQVHAPEVIAKRRPWLQSYRSWYARPDSHAGDREYNYRLTEMTFEDLRPQPGAGGYSQYASQALDWGVGDAFYSRTEAFSAPARRPPTAILVEGATEALPPGIRETTAIAFSGAAPDPDAIAAAAADRPGVLAVRVSGALAADESTLRDAFLFPSPWQFLVETVHADAPTSPLRSPPASTTEWPSRIGASFTATCRTRTEPDHDYLERMP